MGAGQDFWNFWIQGPHFTVIQKQEAEAGMELTGNAATEDCEACDPPDAVMAEISLPLPPYGHNTTAAVSKGFAAYSCTSALGSLLINQQISNFDKHKQVYKKEELSPLPFEPPKFHEYLTQMTVGTIKVANYVVTVLVALTTIHEALYLYQQTSVQVDPWQFLVLFLFLYYPAFTLAGIVMANNDTAVRRFLYYRLLSVQIIVDWDNTPIQKYWMAFYLLTSSVLLLAYSTYGWVVADQHGGGKLGAQWSIVFGQCLLLGNFWCTITQFEQQLISMNKVIENSPEAAKELITLCDVVSEAELKHAISQCYKRAEAFEKLPAQQQEEAKLQLLKDGVSEAAFFDLDTLRNRSKVQQMQESDQPTLSCWSRLACWLDFICNPWSRHYALAFASTMYKFKVKGFISRLLRGQSRAARDASPRVAWWPYHDDDKYLSALGAFGVITVIAVYGVMVYSIYLVITALHRETTINTTMSGALTTSPAALTS